MNKALITAICWATLVSAGHADWLSFRGNNGNGVADGAAPTKCDEDSIVWTADVPGRGVSGPIVVGDQLIVTASSGVREDRLHVISYDTRTGEQLWHRQFWATGRTICHPTSANAAPTPASDGEHIVAFFSSNDCVCLSLDGELKWYRGLGSDYPKVGNDVGMASSPIIANGVVVCQAESQGDSFVVGMDVTNGRSLWRLERPRDSNWTSPLHLTGDSDMVLLKCDESVSAHDLQTGDEVWKLDAEAGGIPCMAISDTSIFVPGSTFMALDRKADVATVAWTSLKLKPNTSPIVDGDRLLFINSAGVLSCHDAKESGDLLWQVRVGGKYWASPIAADGYIYAVNDRGALTIVDRDGNKVSEHMFDDTVMGSPVISDGALYVRGVSKLWKVANR